MGLAGACELLGTVAFTRCQSPARSTSDCSLAAPNLALMRKLCGGKFEFQSALWLMRRRQKMTHANTPRSSCTRMAHRRFGPNAILVSRLWTLLEEVDLFHSPSQSIRSVLGKSIAEGSA